LPYFLNIDWALSNLLIVGGVIAVGPAYYVSDLYETSVLLITTIIFSSIIVFETVGSPLTKLAIKFAGEIKTDN
jgi:hypothetical protein